MFNRSAFAAIVAGVTLSLGLCAPASAVLAKNHVAASGATPTALLSRLHLFVHGSSTLYNPDGIVITRRFVFVDWQGQSDHLPGPSTIVKYDHYGKALGSVRLNGRCDGLRLNPVTHLIWATVNNDGMNSKTPRQPYLATIDPRTLTTKLYAFPNVQPHGGGYDDIAFVNGQAFLAASSPVLNAAGINDKPIAVKADLTADGKVDVTPIMYGNGLVFDVNAGKYDHGNISDPDSLAVDNHNNLVVVGDNDQELIVIEHPGQAKQSALRYGFATQFDDVAWTVGTSGTLWIADTDPTVNAVYTVRAKFQEGTVFGETGLEIPFRASSGRSTELTR